MLKVKRKTVVSMGLAMLIAAALYFGYKLGLFHKSSVADIRNYISNFGLWAPVIYIIMFTLVPLTLFPDAVLAVAGGMIFGVWLGALYTIIGAVCGGTLSFFIARHFGRGLVEKLIKHKAQWFDDGVEKKGFLLILILRLVPLVPFDVISYGAGLSKIKFKDFLTATAIGIVPGVLVYSNLGDKSGSASSAQFIIACLILLALFGVSFVLKKKFTFSKLQTTLVEDAKEV
jgi:uncharacterized membrane protein YdjX (TVP38/TMEM64 family)